MRRTGRTSQVINLVNLDIERIDDVVMNQLEILVADPMLDVLLPASEEIVGDNNFMTLVHQNVDKVRAHETCSTRYLEHSKNTWQLIRTGRIENFSWISYL